MSDETDKIIRRENGIHSFHIRLNNNNIMKNLAVESTLYLLNAIF